mmetsp:Transcript_25948/g.46881  ORF Transcript_25948/g.46881 Transcript_25948/m.46881 type:complete len:88 (-) Transcript_25948:678-941(-)
MGLSTWKQHAKHLMSLLQMHWIRFTRLYECMYKARTNGGVACVQSECTWINLNLISDVVHCCNEILITPNTRPPTFHPFLVDKLDLY